MFTSSFLADCVDKYETTIIYLSTDKSVRQERYKERGSNQDETWLRGRESKIANIMTNMALMFNTEKFANNNKNEQEIVYDYILNLIKE